MRLIEKVKTKLQGMKGMRKTKPKMWRPDRTYNVGDKVRYRGKTYECVIGNTSNSAEVPSSSSNWQVVTGTGTHDGHDVMPGDDGTVVASSSSSQPNKSSSSDKATDTTVAADTGDIE